MRKFIAALAASSLFVASAAVAQKSSANSSGNGKALGKANGNNGKALGKADGGKGKGEGKALGKDKDRDKVVGPGKGNSSEEGKAFGKGPRVCLITFDDEDGARAEDVIKAQYLPLGVAVAHKKRVSGDFQTINTYGPEGADDVGVDAARLEPQEVDPTLDFTEGDSTREVCAFLAELADEKDGEEEEEAGDDSKEDEGV